MSPEPTPAFTRRGRRRLKRLRSRFGGRCFYCTCPMTLPTEPNSSKYTRVTRDHLVPRSKGGLRNTTNTVAACYTCNNLRGNMPWLDFYVLIRLRLSSHPFDCRPALLADAPNADPRRVLSARHHAFPESVHADEQLAAAPDTQSRSSNAA